MDTGATEILKFISMENMHHYNSTMVNVDHVDQMRVSYRVDHCLAIGSGGGCLCFGLLECL